MASGAAAPETYVEALTALGSTGIVPADLAARLSGAVRLRNILVHAYLDLDHGRLFDELGWNFEPSELSATLWRQAKQ